jgi:NitT/TauT family transport system permease protein
LTGLSVGEFAVGQNGLGATILLAQGMFDTTRAFAAILLLGLIGLALFFALEMLERYLLPWHVSQRISPSN